VGPVGLGASAVTANLSVDIVYARAKGLYAAISLDGAVVATRDALNRAYYGTAVTPMDILIRREVTNPRSTARIAAIAKVAGGQRPGVVSVVAGERCVPAPNGLVPREDRMPVAVYWKALELRRVEAARGRDGVPDSEIPCKRLSRLGGWRSRRTVEPLAA